MQAIAKNSACTATLLLSAISALVPASAHALVAGGGYQVYEQVTSIPATVTGNGFQLYQSGNTVAGYSAGGGFTTLNGGNPAAVAIAAAAAVVPTPSPAPSGGGGGGGGGGGIGLVCSVINLFNAGYCVPAKKAVVATTSAPKYSDRDIIPDGVFDLLDFNIMMINMGDRGKESLCEGQINAKARRKRRGKFRHIGSSSFDGICLTWDKQELRYPICFTSLVAIKHYLQPAYC